MKIVFMGYITNSDTANSLYGASVAGNKMQLNLIKELMKDKDFSIDLITVYPVAPFPSVKQLYIKKKKIDVYNGITSTRVSFINIPIIKQFWQMIAVYEQGKKIVKKDKDCVILTYNMFPQVGTPMLKLQKKYNCKGICLLADLPLEVSEKKGLMSYFYKWYYRTTEKNIKNTKNLIVLNKEAQRLYAPKSDYIVIDGGIDVTEIKYDSISFLNKGMDNIGRRILLYSGALTKYNGIIELIDAMDKIIFKDVVLHIYGDGPLKDYVKEKCLTNDKLVYYGRLENGIVQQKQREAFLLINPRIVDDPVSRVTFPSKIFEYMLSGTPVLTTKLNGFTEDYYSKMFFAESNHSEVLAEKINEILNTDFSILSNLAKSARDFVIREKNWEKQGAKIAEYIKKVGAK